MTDIHETDIVEEPKGNATEGDGVNPEEEFKAVIQGIMEQAYLKGFNNAIETLSGVMYASSFQESRPEIKRYMQSLSIELSRMKMSEKDLARHNNAGVNNEAVDDTVATEGDSGVSTEDSAPKADGDENSEK